LVSLTKKWNLFWGNHNIFGGKFWQNPQIPNFCKVSPEDLKGV
jgi:hypothetical protein